MLNNRQWFDIYLHSFDIICHSIIETIFHNCCTFCRSTNENSCQLNGMAVHSVYRLCIDGSYQKKNSFSICIDFNGIHFWVIFISFLIIIFYSLFSWLEYMLFWEQWEHQSLDYHSYESFNWLSECTAWVQMFSFSLHMKDSLSLYSVQ